ncbi:MAG: integration host factor subunit beta [Mariprofundales bacterium]
MTKSKLIEQVIKNTTQQMSRSEAQLVVEVIFDAISDALVKGDNIELRGFGSFTARHREARVGRNPKSGELVEIAAKNVPHFKPGKELRQSVDYPEA